MITERFIQDAISCPHRIQRLLNSRNLDWQFYESKGDELPADVVNQEFSFSSDGIGGRVDVVATFENRSKLVLCEVKRGSVGDNELEQLLWYVEEWDSDGRKVADKSLSSIDGVTGLLLAQDFFPIDSALLKKAAELNVFFVQFNFDSQSFPFQIVQPSVRPNDPFDGEVSTTTLRHSSLWTESDWHDYCHSEILEEFKKWSDCLLDAGDERISWITKIYKERHVAIHYKGEYIIWLCPKSKEKRLNGAYGLAGTSTSISLTHDSVAAKPALEAIINTIDQKYADVIPNGFHW